ncbi:MAG: hypothetical protein ACRDPT_08830 [Streptomycetales bacterium]
MRQSHGMDRRAFLARVGVLGVAACTPGLLPRVAQALPGDPGAGEVLDVLRPALAELARDTLNGLAAFAVPGPDPYSAAQGTPSAAPGALDAGTPDFLIHALDHFVPAPDLIVDPLAAALAANLGGVALPLTEPLTRPPTQPLPGDLVRVPAGDVRKLGDALRLLLESDETVPLSLLVALLLNELATRVNPAALRGPFVAPFARLSYAEKAEAFRLLEGPDAGLVAAIDGGLPEPARHSVSGALRFVGGALLEFSAFGTFTEFAVFDRATGRLTGRPVGWQLTGFLPGGPVEGWDEFRGYYQGRTRVDG